MVHNPQSEFPAISEEIINVSLNYLENFTIFTKIRYPSGSSRSNNITQWLAFFSHNKLISPLHSMRNIVLNYSAAIDYCHYLCNSSGHWVIVRSRTLEIETR